MLSYKTLAQFQSREKLRTASQKHYSLIEKLCSCIGLLIFGLATWPVPKRQNFPEEVRKSQ